MLQLTVDSKGFLLVPAEGVLQGKAVVIFTAGFSSGFAPHPNDFLSLDGKKVIKERSRLEKFS